MIALFNLFRKTTVTMEQLDLVNQARNNVLNMLVRDECMSFPEDLPIGNDIFTVLMRQMPSYLTENIKRFHRMRMTYEVSDIKAGPNEKAKIHIEIPVSKSAMIDFHDGHGQRTVQEKHLENEAKVPSSARKKKSRRQKQSAEIEQKTAPVSGDLGELLTALSSQKKKLMNKILDLEPVRYSEAENLICNGFHGKIIGGRCKGSHRKYRIGSKAIAIPFLDPHDGRNMNSHVEPGGLEQLKKAFESAFRIADVNYRAILGRQDEQTYQALRL